MLYRTLLCSAAALTVLATATPGQAETVTTKTYTETEDIPNVQEVDFSVFDTNKDGLYSMPEVGERLFLSFDKDSNGYIDNKEWNHRAVMTITPMKKETFKFIDYNDDGLTDASSYSYEKFYQASGLIRFDKNQNGLSASEFIGVGFEALDKDNDKLISPKEWKEAYLSSRPAHEQPENYN